jgi:hypothetical protein
MSPHVWFCRWIALPEDAQEEAAAATGFQPLAAETLQPLELYGKAASSVCYMVTMILFEVDLLLLCMT